ncbi:MAG: ester cyclase, partial [Thermaurantiacus sp.]
VRMFRNAMPDMRMTLVHALAQGDAVQGWGVDVWTLTGTHTGTALFGIPAAGRPVAISGIDWLRVDGGMVTELWHVEDMSRMADQLGLAIPPARLGVDLGTRRIADAPTLPGPNLSDVECRSFAVARRHLEGLWRDGNVAVASEVYAPDVKDMNPAPGQRTGIPGILDAMRFMRDAAPDLRLEIAAWLVDGPLVADRWVMTGTHTGAPLFGIKASGKPFAIHGMDVVHVTPDARIDQVWHVEDFFTLRSQIA